jgi:hypothetical protein
MSLTSDMQSSSGVDQSNIAGEYLEGEPGYGARTRARARVRVVRNKARRVVRDAFVPGLAMSAACLGALFAASAQHSKSPWSGINAVSRGILGERPSSRFDPRHALVSLGTIVAGSIAMAMIQRPIMSRSGVGRSRVGTAALAGLGSWAFDRFVMRRPLMPALNQSIGLGGVILKYGAIGIAAALARRSFLGSRYEAFGDRSRRAGDPRIVAYEETTISSPTYSEGSVEHRVL